MSAQFKLDQSKILQRDSFFGAPAASGSSFEDLLAFLRQQRFPIKAIPPDPRGGFNWRSDCVIGSGTSVWRTQFSADWSYTCESDDQDLAVAFLTAGAADMVVGTRPALRTPSSAGLVTLPALRNHKIHAINGAFSGVILRFDASVVANVLAAIFDCQTLAKLDLTPTIDLSSETGRTLYLIAQSIVAGMHNEQLLRRSPIALASLTEAALRLILENVPHNLSHRLDGRTPDVTPKHVRQAIDYMKANLHLPLTMIDLRNALGVSDRSLQLGFRKFRDTTPLAYLRRIRLEAVHAELSQPENMLPVSEVALKWGFAHMGRFAAQYRMTFGVNPSDTAKHAFRRAKCV